MFHTLRLPAPSAVRLILLGAALALSSCGDSSDNDGSISDKYAAQRQACTDRINAFRATLQLPPLERWTEQEQCTDREAAGDSQSGKAHGEFGSCKEGAQNECPGWGSIEQTIQGCLQSMWDEGPGEPYSEHGHYINMSNPEYTQVACGFHETPDGEVWAIQNFR